MNVIIMPNSLYFTMLKITVLKLIGDTVIILQLSFSKVNFTSIIHLTVHHSSIITKRFYIR